VNRAQRRKLEKKVGKKSASKIKAVETAMSGMPSVCKTCGAHFDKNDKSSLDSWRVAIYDDGAVVLTCEKCFKASENPS
tara:strand:+ start:42 stop:278 length:237 start_codon:yes stop_codon:yes gene_type:complete